MKTIMIMTWIRAEQVRKWLINQYFLGNMSKKEDTIQSKVDIQELTGESVHQLCKYIHRWIKVDSKNTITQDLNSPKNPQVDVVKKGDFDNYDDNIESSQILSPEILSKLTEINKSNAYSIIKNRLEVARLEQVEANNRILNMNYSGYETLGK